MMGDHNKNMGLAADKLMKLNHSQLESATVNYESSMDGPIEQRIEAPQSGMIASTVKMYSQKKLHGHVSKHYRESSDDPYFDDCVVAEEDESLVNPDMNDMSYGSETFAHPETRSKPRHRPTMTQQVFTLNNLNYNNSPVGVIEIEPTISKKNIPGHYEYDSATTLMTFMQHTQIACIKLNYSLDKEVQTFTQYESSIIVSAD